MAKRTSTTILPAAAILSVVLLAIAHRASGDDTIPPDKAQLSSWFQANVGPVSDRKGALDPALVEAEASPQVIKVSASGGGQFKTISEAVQSVPSGNTNRVIISIAPGTYQEQVKIARDQPFITFLGDPNADTTLVAGGTAKEFGTVNSATLIVEGDYFMAANMIIQNSAPMPTGEGEQQALALRLTGDKAAIYKSKIYGFQDTVCDDKGKHFFMDCLIQGTVDFIFGNGKSIYLNTQLEVLNSGGYTMITAPGGDGPSEDTGFSMVHCSIIGTATNAMLGRAWMPYPRVVYAYTEMSNAVSPEAWSDNFHKERDNTVFYGEYQNTGPGADRSKRAPFSKELSADEVKPFLSLAYIDGAKWLLPPPQV